MTLSACNGVFTTIRVEDGEPIWLADHLARLREHARIAGLPALALTEAQVRAYTRSHKGLARLRILRTDDDHRLDMERYEPPRGPLRVGIYPEPVRQAPIKMLPYDHRHRVREWALAHGYDDALTVSLEGYLLEAAYANLVWMYEGKLYTPDRALPLLEGIFVRRLSAISIRVCRLPEGAKSFLCNCLQKIIPVEIFYSI